MYWIQDRDSTPSGYTIDHPTTLHTRKNLSDPLLLADGTLRCGMYPAGKVAISQHLATPGFPQFDHNVGKLSAVAAHW